MRYSPDDVDPFFSRILPLPAGLDSCDINAFVKLNDNTIRLEWMSFVSSCLEMQISTFLFSSEDIEHQVYLTGSSDPPTPDNLWGEASVMVYSLLSTPSLYLNKYMAVLQPTSGPTISAGFWKGGKEEGKIYKAEFSLLGAYFITHADISPDYLLFSANANLFGKYNSQIRGKLPRGYSWSNVPFTVSGEFETGPTSFLQSLENYTQSYAITKVALAEKRISNAEAAKNNSLQQLQAIQASYNQSLLAKQAAVSEYQQALQREVDANVAVAAAQAKVDIANQEVLEAQGRVSSVCDLTDCPLDCVPGVTCLPCDNYFDFENWNYCERVKVEDKVNYRTVTTTDKRCVHQQQCRITTKVKRWALTTFAQTCSYICLPEEIISTKEDSFYAAVNISHAYPCSTSLSSLSISQTCCTEDPCSQSLQNVNCIYQNAVCELAREPAYESLNETEKLLVAPLQELGEAMVNLSIAVAQVTAAEAKKNLTEQEFQLLQSTYATLSHALATSEADYHRVVTDEQPILDFRNFLLSYSIEDLLQIEQLGFSVTFQEASPSIIPVTITIFIPNLIKLVNLTVSVDLTAPNEIVKNEFSNQILSHIGIILSNSTADTKRKRQAVEQLPANARHFERNCATITNLESYLIGINTTLDSVSAHLQRAQQNVTHTINHIKLLTDLASYTTSSVNYTFLQNQFNYTTSESVLREQAQNSSLMTSVTEAINSIVITTESLLESIGNDAFISWQVAMGGVSAVSGRNCFGFVDCLTITGSLTQELLEDTPIELASILLTALPVAKQTLTQLALATNLSTIDAKSNTAPMITLLTELEATDYWCSAPPVITEQAQSKINVDRGHQLSLTCRANSTLSVAYSWKKNGFALPRYNTSTFIKTNAQLTDEGVYQCLATNPISTTPSLYSTVELFEPPVITLSPADFTTFEGDDNGAPFICNATGRPPPNYQWYWSISGDDWSVVSNSSSNELVLLKPTKEQEGWYRCQAYTDNGLVTSGLARLTILSVSISKLVFPVSFQLNLLNTTYYINSSGMPNTTELIKQPLIKALIEHLSLTTQIGDINISPAMNNSVSVSLTVFTEHEFPLNETLADIALLASHNYESLLTDIANLEQFLRNSFLKLNSGMHVFGVVPETTIISDLKYDCPVGHALKYNNFLCSKWNKYKLFNILLSLSLSLSLSPSLLLSLLLSFSLPCLL